MGPSPSPALTLSTQSPPGLQLTDPSLALEEPPHSDCGVSKKEGAGSQRATATSTPTPSPDLESLVHAVMRTGRSRERTSVGGFPKSLFFAVAADKQVEEGRGGR